MFNKISKLFLFLLICFPCLTSALSFPLPKTGNEIVGALQNTEIEEGEDFSDIALRFKIGYYELFETNPRINPDNPPAFTQVIIPTQYILPHELKPNQILINLAEMRLYFIPLAGKNVYIFPIGIGKVDWDTPTGTMHIINKIANPTWTVPEGIRKYRAAHNDFLPKVMPAGPENPMGSFALRLSGGDYLIHGTNLPAGIGRRSSAGCIRMYEEDIKQLFSMVKVGTPVLIINKPYKAGWHNGKLYLEAHLPLFEQRLEHASGDMSQVIDIVEAAIKSNQKKSIQIRWNNVFRIAKEHLGVPMLMGSDLAPLLGNAKAQGKI
jgi:L,D-transpeptidase ErfK/SrfK